MIAPSHGLIWRSHGAEIVVGVSRLGQPAGQAEGAGDLRHDVGEHRHDGPEAILDGRVAAGREHVD